MSSRSNASCNCHRENRRRTLMQSDFPLFDFPCFHLLTVADSVASIGARVSPSYCEIFSTAAKPRTTMRCWDFETAAIVSPTDRVLTFAIVIVVDVVTLSMKTTLFDRLVNLSARQVVVVMEYNVEFMISMHNMIPVFERRSHTARGQTQPSIKPLLGRRSIVVGRRVRKR